MSVYDLYQYYLNQLQNPVMDSPVVQQEAVNPLLYLQQQQGGEGEGSTDNTTTPTSNAGITSISGFADYLGSPGMIGGALFGPFGAAAGKGIAQLVSNFRDPYTNIFGNLKPEVTEAIQKDTVKEMAQQNRESGDRGGYQSSWGGGGGGDFMGGGGTSAEMGSF